MRTLVRNSMAIATTALAVAAMPAMAADPAPNGITLPEGYQDWRMIASSQRNDNDTMRVILGNDVAVQAARSGNTNPWPDGTILAKLVWKNEPLPEWDGAIVPGEFVHAEFMHKDAKKWADTGGWGFARWVGMEQAPYGKDPGFVQECFGCHQPVKDRDYTFTHPAPLPGT